jgi:hypothetical protein
MLGNRFQNEERTDFETLFVPKYRRLERVEAGGGVSLEAPESRAQGATRPEEM